MEREFFWTYWMIGAAACWVFTWIMMVTQIYRTWMILRLLREGDVILISKRALGGRSRVTIERLKTGTFGVTDEDQSPTGSTMELPN